MNHLSLHPTSAIDNIIGIRWKLRLEGIINNNSLYDDLASFISKSCSFKYVIIDYLFFMLQKV